MEARTNKRRGTDPRKPAIMAAQPVVVTPATKPISDFDRYWSCRWCGRPHTTDAEGRNRTGKCQWRADGPEGGEDDDEESPRRRRKRLRREKRAYYARLDRMERDADRREERLDFGQIDRPRTLSERLRDGFASLNN